MVADKPPATGSKRGALRPSWKLVLGIGGGAVVIAGAVWWGFAFGPFRMQAPHSGSGVATGGYLAVLSQEVDFIQLTLNGSSARGTFSQARLESTTVSSQQHAFSGTGSVKTTYIMMSRQRDAIFNDRRLAFLRSLDEKSQ